MRGDSRGSSSLLLATAWVVLGCVSLGLVLATAGALNEHDGSAWPWALSAAAVAAVFLGLTVWLWRTDPVGLAVMTFVFLLPPGVAAWVASENFSATELATLGPGTFALGYVLWRNLGPSGPDRLTDCDFAFDLRGVGLGWREMQRSTPGVVRFRVHNARLGGATLRLRLSTEGSGARSPCFDHCLALQPDEAGTLTVRLPSLPHGSHTLRVRASVTRQGYLAPRSYLRARTPFPIGPAIAATGLALLAGDLNVYGAPIVGLRGGASDLQPGIQWVPDGRESSVR